MQLAQCQFTCVTFHPFEFDYVKEYACPIMETHNSSVGGLFVKADPLKTAKPASLDSGRIHVNAVDHSGWIL